MRRQILRITIVITYIFFSCSSNQSNNQTSDTTSTNTTVEASQSNRQPSKEEIENWIIEKLTRYKKDVNKNSDNEKTIINNFEFQDDYLLVTAKNSKMSYDKNGDLASSLDCDETYKILIRSFKTLDEFPINDSQGKYTSDGIAINTNGNGISYERDCSFNLPAINSSQKWQPSKSTTPILTIGFNINTEKNIVTRLDSAFKTLRDNYYKKEAF